MALVLKVDAWWQRTDAGLRLRRRGDELTVDGETEAWLRTHGLAGEPEAEEEAAEPEPEAEPEAEEEAGEKAAEPVEKPARTQKPAKAAPVDEWRAYAKASGVDPAGLSKAEIIAATR